jgi:hypothetical protein
VEALVGEGPASRTVLLSFGAIGAVSSART